MQQKRSLFGPLLLIAAGVIWLLIRAGTIPQANLWALTYVWPFLLIAARIGLILRPYWAYTSILMDILIIGGLVLSILYAPQLGWDQPSGMFTYTFTQEGENFYMGPSERGSGNMVTETRQVSGFDSIKVDYPARVLISQGSTETLKIEAEDNVLPGLKTEVKGKELRIYYKSQDGKHVNATKMVVITITAKELSSLGFSSAGESIVDGLKSDDLSVSLDGAGNVKLNDITVGDLRAWAGRPGARPGRPGSMTRPTPGRPSSPSRCGTAPSPSPAATRVSSRRTASPPGTSWTRALDRRCRAS